MSSLHDDFIDELRELKIEHLINPYNDTDSVDRLTSLFPFKCGRIDWRADERNFEKFRHLDCPLAEAIDWLCGHIRGCSKCIYVSGDAEGFNSFSVDSENLNKILPVLARYPMHIYIYDGGMSFVGEITFEGDAGIVRRSQ